MLKSGWKTSEFWLSLLTTVAGAAGVVSGVVPGTVGSVLATVSAVGYAISRGLAKQAQ